MRSKCPLKYGDATKGTGVGFWHNGAHSTPTTKCLGHTSHTDTHHAPPTASDAHCGKTSASSQMMANTSAGSPAQQRGAAFLSEPSRAKPRRPLQQHLERRRLLEPQQLRRQRPPELVHLGGLDREAVVELPPSETTSHAPLRVLPHGIARELDRRAECLSARSSQLGIWESAFTVLSCVCVLSCWASRR